MGAFESPHGGPPECPCTWREQLRVLCKPPREPGRATVKIKITRGVHDGEVTLRFDKDPETDRVITLDGHGRWSGSVRRRVHGNVRVDVVGCHVWGAARCE